MIPGQFNSLYLNMRLELAAGTDSPSNVAEAVSRIRLVLQICAMDVASVTVNELLAGISQSQPSSVSEQCCDVSLTSDPMLVVAVNWTMPFTVALLVISISQ